MSNKEDLARAAAEKEYPHDELAGYAYQNRFFEGFLAGYDARDEEIKAYREALAITAECENCGGCRQKAREALERFK